MRPGRRDPGLSLCAFALSFMLICSGCVFPPAVRVPIAKEWTPILNLNQVQLSPPPEILPGGAVPPAPSPAITPTLNPGSTLAAPTPTATFTTAADTSPTGSPTTTNTLPPGTLLMTPASTPTGTTMSLAGSSTPTNTSVFTSPTHTDPAPTATLPPTALSCAPNGNSSFESALFGLINTERQSRGLGLLSIQALLNTASRNHSTDMACNSFFSHTGSDGSLPWDRVNALGYRYTSIAENIFAGSSNAQAAFNAWMDSSGHRENMLNPAYTEIGIGYQYWSNSPYGAYTTTVFASPQ